MSRQDERLWGMHRGAFAATSRAAPFALAVLAVLGFDIHAGWLGFVTFTIITFLFIGIDEWSSGEPPP